MTRHVGTRRTMRAERVKPSKATKGIRPTYECNEHDVCVVVSSDRRAEGWIALHVDGVEIVRFEKQPGDVLWMAAIVDRKSVV